MSDFFATPWTRSCQAPLSREFSRQEYWSGLRFLTPRDPPDPQTEPASPVSSAPAGGFFTTGTTWESKQSCFCIGRELNPGLPHSRRELYHWITPKTNSFHIGVCGPLADKSLEEHIAHIWVFNLLSKAGVSPLETAGSRAGQTQDEPGHPMVPESKDMLERGGGGTKDIGAT